MARVSSCLLYTSLPSFALSPQGTASSFDKGKAVQTYTLPVAASLKIDILGRIRNAKRQARALLEQSRDYKQAVRTPVSYTHLGEQVLEGVLDATFIYPTGGDKVMQVAMDILAVSYTHLMPAAVTNVL